MSLTFNAIDVETANADRASICQIGIVRIKDGKINDTWQTLVDPEDWFDEFNIGIHGIEESDVVHSPTMVGIRDDLRKLLRGSILVSHTSFDRVAFERAMNKYNLEQLQVTWLDSAKIVRRAWPDKFGSSGYGLKNVAYEFDIEFKHHDALEDARAAALVVLRACKDAGTDIEGWLERVNQRITKRTSKPRRRTYDDERREGNAEGPLYGETVVFTGSLKMVRREAADLAASLGCDVDKNVTKRTTLLVVGIQDKTRLKGYKISTKHRKVIDEINKGQDIQILSEADFADLVRGNE